jgi:hypothetical protein
MTRAFVPVTDPTELRPGDVVAMGPASWRIVTDVRPATHPLAAAAGAFRIDVLGWQSGRPMSLTWFPHKRPWEHVGTAAELGWTAPAGANVGSNTPDHVATT